MSEPVSAREALLTEAIGEAATLIESAERLSRDIREAAREFDRANTSLRASMGTFEDEIKALSGKAKIQAVNYILAHAQEATKRSIETQGQAMAEAARVALGAELGAHLRRLQAAIQSLTELSNRRWEQWLTSAAIAAAASAATWAMTELILPR